MTHSPKSVLLLGATGTIGRATANALVAAGYKVTAPVRSGSDAAAMAFALPCTITQTALLSMMTEHACEAVISCVASRSAVPSDARAIDHDLNSAALNAAMDAGVTQFVLLSAICVQRPKLAFQQAKLAFEAKLRAAPLTWSIVRPTAFFKSLLGQLKRVRAGKPFLLFGDGELTACKPISNDDLACYLVQCLTDTTLQNRILPIGGPGPAMTPRAQGEMLFQALGQTPRFKHVPIAMMSAIVSGLSIAGKVSSRLRDKAELARIGRYYATESMLVWDDAAGLSRLEIHGGNTRTYCEQKACLVVFDTGIPCQKNSTRPPRPKRDSPRMMPPVDTMPMPPQNSAARRSPIITGVLQPKTSQTIAEITQFFDVKQGLYRPQRGSGNPP